MAPPAAPHSPGVVTFFFGPTLVLAFLSAAYWLLSLAVWAPMAFILILWIIAFFRSRFCQA